MLHVAECLGIKNCEIIARSPLAAWAPQQKLIARAYDAEALPMHQLHLDAPGETNYNPSLLTIISECSHILSFLGNSDHTTARTLKRINPSATLLAIDPVPSESEANIGTHITEQWMKQISLPPPCSTTPWLLPSHRCIAPESLSDNKTDKLRHSALIHPGSGGLEKCCPLDALELLATTLQTDYEVRWIIGPDEMERFNEEYFHRLQKTAPAIYEESIDRAIEQVHHTDLYIGMDTGLTHVAAMCGVATCALFGPSNCHVWQPLGPLLVVGSFPDQRIPLATWVRAQIDLIASLQDRKPV